MLKLSKHKQVLHLLRFAATAILIIPLYIYLNDILSPWFIAGVLFTAIAAGITCNRLSLRLLPAVLLIALSSLVVRIIFLSLAGVLTAVFNSAALDFSLFSFDSGFFPLLPLFIYVAVSWFVVLRKPGFIIVEIILNSLIYALLLWSQGGYSMTLFSHPGLLAAFSIVFFIVELLVLLFGGLDRAARTRLGFIIIVIPLFLATVFFLFNRYSEGAAKDGGGLMQPTLFRFDFSDYVKLETEISMDNDLVMLFRNYGYLNSVYLKRFHLSGYKADSGFFLQKGPGEGEQLLTLPEIESNIETERFLNRIESEQEYFIVNFDPTSVIAMNYPVKISPLTNWNGSSFLRNYRVVSETVELPSWELADAPLLEMDDELFNYYTDFGSDQLIKELAEEVTFGLVTPYDRVIAIMFYLHDRYFYSLKPGVATDGNQLHHFLFDAKKGYCSYFAFSMALMCRSIGIPARVAAGFFIDPQSGILNVYPVREDMAHAWVEVPFENFGWVEFDPTTDRIAPGEDLEFADLDSAEYAGLVEEIFSNEYTIELQDEEFRGDETGQTLNSIVRRLGRLIRSNAGWILPLSYIVFVLLYRVVEAAAKRSVTVKKRIVTSYRTAFSLCKALGWPRQKNESVLEYAERISSGIFPSFLPLSERYLELVFSAEMDASSIVAADSACSDFFKAYRKIPVWKRFVIFFFPFFRFIRSSKTLILIFLIVLSINIQALYAEDMGSADDYLDLAALEQDGENYEAALNLLNEGITLFPESWELKLALGNLYSEKELYNLALDQYRLAMDISSENPDVLYPKSVAEGLLNFDEQSILTLEGILEIDSVNYDALADLGWMYFKTFRLAEAESLLLKAIETYDDSPILNMTLGTVYSGMYEYENAEYYYLESINMALEKGWEYFASVSYYNLSLLEYGFYNYEKAFEYTNKSIEYGERAPGYISKAEIYLGRLDFEAAFMNYQQAYIIDSTPLALMGQADLYMTFGLLDEALSHISEVLRHDDESWMYYFGVDPDRHRMETDRILMEIYQAMAVRERYRSVSGLDSLKSLFLRIKYKSLGWYHARRYRQASFEVGKSNEKQGNMLDASWAYFVANEEYKNQAERYLARAELIETSAAPDAEAAYMLERGRLNRDAEILSEAVKALDPEWERFQIVEALTQILLLQADDESPAAVQLAEDIYGLNPGVFITKGLAFPLALDFDAGYFLRRALLRSGFNILPNNHYNRYRYRLSAADNQSEGILYSVLDSETDHVLFDITIPDKLNTPQKASAFTAELKKRLFSIADGKDVHF